MKLIKRTYNYAFAEPLTWLFCYFFQPAKFLKEIEERLLFRRAIRMFRLILPLFLISYILSFVGELISYIVLHIVGLTPLLFTDLLSYQGVLLFFVAAWTLLSLVLGSVLSITTGVASCIAFGAAIGIIFGGIGFTVHSVPYFLMFGSALGVAFGIPFGIREDIPKHNLFTTIANSIAKGIVACLIIGIALDTTFTLHPFLGNELGFNLGDDGNSEMLGGFIFGIGILCLVLSFSGDISSGFGSSFEATIRRRIIKGLTRGLSVGITSSIVTTIWIGILLGISFLSTPSLPSIIIAGSESVVSVGIAVLIILLFTKGFRLNTPLTIALGFVFGILISIIGILSIGRGVAAVLGSAIGIVVSLIAGFAANRKRGIIIGSLAGLVTAALIYIASTITSFYNYNTDSLYYNYNYKDGVVYGLIVGLCISVVIGFAAGRQSSSVRRGNGQHIAIGLLLGGITGAIVGVVAGTIQLTPGTPTYSGINALAIGITFAIIYSIMCTFIARNQTKMVPVLVASTLVGITTGVFSSIEYGFSVGLVTGIVCATATSITAGLARNFISGKPRNILVALTSGAVAGSIAGSMVGITSNALSGITAGIIVNIAVILILIVIVGVADIRSTGPLKDGTRGVIVGLVAGVVTAFAAGITGLGVIVGVVVSFIAGISAASKRRTALSLASGIIAGIVIGFIVNKVFPSVSRPLLIIVPQSGSSATSTISGLVVAIFVISFIFGFIAAITYSIGPNITAGVTRGITFGIISGLFVWAIMSTTPTQLDALSSFLGSLILCITCIVSYLIIYYRLPIYGFSSISLLRAYQASKRKPTKVFEYLHRSALYWDEQVPFPLPVLRQLLLLAAEQNQNQEQVLKEIDFIVHQRPRQIAAAQDASLAIAIRDLELHTNIQGIAEASERLANILPQEARLIDPLWVAPFAHLKDASKNAASYCSPLGWEARHRALTDMIGSLKLVYPNAAFRDPTLNQRLEKIVDKWLQIAHDELKDLDKSVDRTNSVKNPYISGPALELHDTLFVGRRDLARQLDDALSKRKGRPTFLLNGERRMGKSSTLKQLPDLLGAYYLPIFFDLQIRGLSSSTVAFLAAIALEIHKTMHEHGMYVKKLEYDQIKNASLENDAAAYRVFDEWFRTAEQILERGDKTLLLTFDEFEKLEEAGNAKYLNLGLLLDWFRSVIQNHPRLALLFSGVQNFGDMGDKWAGYFVNVQMLKVSFLKYSEAYQLITQPVPEFPSQEIFGEGAIEDILHATYYHPFLIQAVCSSLMDTLNANKRLRAEHKDVTDAIKRVLKNWGSSYFLDLWNRTNSEQRLALIAIKDQGQGDALSIKQCCNFDERTLMRTLQSLEERDLVFSEQNCYRIAVPLMSEWIEFYRYH